MLSIPRHPDLDHPPKGRHRLGVSRRVAVIESWYQDDSLNNYRVVQKNSCMFEFSLLTSAH